MQCTNYEAFTILEILISVTLVIIAVYSSCISIINGVNLCKPIHGNIITVTGLRNYIKFKGGYLDE